MSDQIEDGTEDPEPETVPVIPELMDEVDPVCPAEDLAHDSASPAQGAQAWPLQVWRSDSVPAQTYYRVGGRP